MREQRDNIVVGLHKDGTLDEVLLYDCVDKLLFHMEQLDTHIFWMRFQGVTQDLIVHLRSAEGDMKADFEWDSPATEAECNKKFATPDAQKRLEVATLVNKYGVAVLLDEIAKVIEGGRKEPHDQQLAKELKDVKDRFVKGDEQYWSEQVKGCYDP